METIGLAAKTKTATTLITPVLIFITTFYSIVVGRSKLGRGAKKMNTDLSLAELLALVEIVDEHVDRNFPGVDPPRVLREIQQKLDTVITRHRTEIDKTIKSVKKTKAAPRGR
jgi:hypothetical protein